VTYYSNGANNDPYWRNFLTPRAYDPHEHEDYLQRAAYAYPALIKERDDRRLLLNNGWGPEPLTVEIACEWAERLARSVLA
jgi:hypothetical protein